MFVCLIIVFIRSVFLCICSFSPFVRSFVSLSVGSSVRLSVYSFVLSFLYSPFVRSFVFPFFCFFDHVKTS